MERKKNTKIKILLFLAFGLVAAVFFAQVTQLTKFGINEINFRKEKLKCEHLDYNLRELSYENKRLMFEIESQDYDTNISSVTIITDKDEEKKTVLQTPIKGGDSQFILFKNVTIEESFYVYPGDCEEIKEEYKIR